ncbi:MAG: cobalamin-independent methionine synthase II family protein [Thaumarchaeota archaeon]|nr:cobalamin-independent methionine synthase II family protein [Nitrososphaerota archaeon]
MNPQPLQTTVVGSYPQPDWLVDRDSLKGRAPPRVKARDIWRVEERFLEQAQDDATLLAIREMESAGIDIITDGEIRRESYSNRFVTALDGMDMDNPGVAIGRTGRPTPVPRVVGPVHRRGPILVRDAKFLREHTDRRTKITLPGPFTLTQQAQNDFYSDDASLARDIAVAVNEEAKALKATGVDVIQIDEPYLQARPEKAKEYAVEVINRSLEGVQGPTAVHSCFGYAYIVKNKPTGYPFLTELNECRAQQLSIEAAQPNLDLAVLESIPEKTIILGVIDLGESRVEASDEVAARIRGALRYVPSERLMLAPDCGMKYVERDIAFGKLRALTQGTRIVNSELGGTDNLI